MSLSHLRSLVPTTGSGITRGPLSKYLSNSLPNRTGNFPALAWGRSPWGRQSPVASASVCYLHPAAAALGCEAYKASATFRPCFLLVLSFQPILTLCLGKSQGNSTFCSWNSCQRDSSRMEHIPHKQRRCHFQRGGFLPSAGPGPPSCPGKRGRVHAARFSPTRPPMVGAPTVGRWVVK